jgi:hypothetical protein
MTMPAPTSAAGGTGPSATVMQVKVSERGTSDHRDGPGEGDLTRTGPSPDLAGHPPG